MTFVYLCRVDSLYLYDSTFQIQTKLHCKIVYKLTVSFFIEEQKQKQKFITIESH